MNALSAEITDTETQQIEDALDALLSAATAADRSRPLRPDRGMISARTLMDETVQRLSTWTPAQARAHNLLRRPVSELTRQGVRTLGERLFEIGGMALMHDVLERVSERDYPNAGRRTSIMDHRWDGIGRTNTSAGWCT